MWGQGIERERVGGQRKKESADTAERRRERERESARVRHRQRQRQRQTEIERDTERQRQTKGDREGGGEGADRGGLISPLFIPATAPASTAAGAPAPFLPLVTPPLMLAPFCAMRVMVGFGAVITGRLLPALAPPPRPAPHTPSTRSSAPGARPSPRPARSSSSSSYIAPSTASSAPPPGTAVYLPQHAQPGEPSRALGRNYRSGARLELSSPVPTAGKPSRVR